MAPTGGHKRESSPYRIKNESNAAQENYAILHWDIWFNITYLFRDDDDRRHLYNLCLVSKDMCCIATPHLYHSVVLGPALERDREVHYPANLRAPTGMDQQTSPVQPALTGSDGDPPPGLPSPGLENLLNRFRNDRTGRLRSQVHILTILNFDRWNRLDRPFTEFVYFGYLGYWITRLPNLSLVRLFCHIPSTLDNLPHWVVRPPIPNGPKAPFTRSIRSHPMKPELQLLGEGTEAKWSGSTLPSITTMHVKLDCFYFRRFYSTVKLCRQPFHRLVFASPNLRTLSIEGPLPVPQAVRFNYNVFNPRVLDMFPPIEKLFINGYSMLDHEWNLWENRFRWDRLLSLSLGPRPVQGFFCQIYGRAVFLKHLKVEGFADHDSCLCLGKFILGFDTLETLELVNARCPILIVTNHPGLVKLCIHQDEPWPGEKRRVVPSAEDLLCLDHLCPLLETLEIDVKRKAGRWPHDVLVAISAGYKNLRGLSLHFELGVVNLREIQAPVLNYQSAQTIADFIYYNRWVNYEMGIPKQPHFPTVFRKLILWTGYPMRDKTDWSPGRAVFEKKHSAFFLIFPPPNRLGEPQLVHWERFQLEDMVIRDRTAKKTKEYKDLKKRVDAAVLGPKLRTRRGTGGTATTGGTAGTGGNGGTGGPAVAGDTAGAGDATGAGDTQS